MTKEYEETWLEGIKPGLHHEPMNDAERAGYRRCSNCEGFGIEPNSEGRRWCHVCDGSPWHSSLAPVGSKP